MEKPVIILTKETEQAVVDALNNSNLPSFILRLMIERILTQVTNLEQQEYNQALKEYAEKSEKGSDNNG